MAAKKRLTKEEKAFEVQVERECNRAAKGLQIPIFELLSLENLVRACLVASKGEPLKDSQIVEMQEYMVKCCGATKTSL